jgi:hypothetical protein
MLASCFRPLADHDRASTPFIPAACNFSGIMLDGLLCSPRSGRHAHVAVVINNVFDAHKRPNRDSAGPESQLARKVTLTLFPARADKSKKTKPHVFVSVSERIFFWLSRSRDQTAIED